MLWKAPLFFGEGRSSGGPESVEEFGLGLLHALGGGGVADGRGDASQGIALEAVAQVLRGMVQRQRCPVAAVAAVEGALRNSYPNRHLLARVLKCAD